MPEENWSVPPPNEIVPAVPRAEEFETKRVPLSSAVPPLQALLPVRLRTLALGIANRTKPFPSTLPE